MFDGLLSCLFAQTLKDVKGFLESVSLSLLLMMKLTRVMVLFISNSTAEND